MVDRVPLLLDALHFDGAGVHVLRSLDSLDSPLQVLGRFDDERAQFPRRIADIADMEDLGPSRGAVQEIDDVVESRGQSMDVLAVERRYEAPVDPGVDLVGQLIRLVLDLLDRANLLLNPAGVREEVLEQARRRRQVSRQLVEEREELLVARNQASKQHAALGLGFGLLQGFTRPLQSSSPEGQSTNGRYARI